MSISDITGGCNPVEPPSDCPTWIWTPPCSYENFGNTGPLPELSIHEHFDGPGIYSGEYVREESLSPEEVINISDCNDDVWLVEIIDFSAVTALAESLKTHVVNQYNTASLLVILAILGLSAHGSIRIQANLGMIYVDMTLYYRVSLETPGPPATFTEEWEWDCWIGSVYADIGKDHHIHEITTTTSTSTGPIPAFTIPNSEIWLHYSPGDYVTTSWSEPFTYAPYPGPGLVWSFPVGELRIVHGGDGDPVLPWGEDLQIKDFIKLFATYTYVPGDSSDLLALAASSECA